jgi:hypothetical protein
MVENSDFTAAVDDELAFPEAAHYLADAGPPRAQHERKKSLRNAKLVGVDTVAGHQQPAGQTLYHHMKAVACRGASSGRREYTLRASNSSNCAENERTLQEGSRSPSGHPGRPTLLCRAIDSSHSRRTKKGRPESRRPLPMPLIATSHR